VIATVLSVVGAVACLIGWLGMMIGPRSLMSFGFGGFVCAVLALMFARRSSIAPARPPSRLQTALRRTIRALYATICVGLLMMFATGRLDGVGEFPALQRRTSYELNNHGARTPVSRTRYVALVVSFATGWTAMALAANVSALYRTLYGRDFE